MRNTIGIWKRLRDRFSQLAVNAGVLAALLGGGLIIAGMLFRIQVTYPWFNAIPIVLGCMLILVGFLRPPRTLLRQAILGCGGVWLIIVALDTWLHSTPLISDAAWAASLYAFLGTDFYTHTPESLLLSERQAQIRRVSGALLCITFGITAGYLMLAQLLGVPPHAGLNECARLGYALWAVLWLTRITNGRKTPIGGIVQICPNCGLRNIVERQTCKRCGEFFNP